MLVSAKILRHRFVTQAEDSLPIATLRSLKICHPERSVLEHGENRPKNLLSPALVFHQICGARTTPLGFASSLSDRKRHNHQTQACTLRSCRHTGSARRGAEVRTLQSAARVPLAQPPRACLRENALAPDLLVHARCVALSPIADRSCSESFEYPRSLAAARSHRKTHRKRSAGDPRATPQSLPSHSPALPSPRPGKSPGTAPLAQDGAPTSSSRTPAVPVTTISEGNGL
jgi:hypothetical protein